MLKPNDVVVYRNNKSVVLSTSDDNRWIRILPNYSHDKLGFVVFHELLKPVEIKEQPNSLKALNPSVEEAREIVKLAFDYQSLYFALQKSKYFQNDFRAWVSKQNKANDLTKDGSFGLLKAMTVAKLAKIIRSKYN